MRIGSGLVLIAVGAVLKFAVTTSISGINLSIVGVVLMVVGIAGVVLSLIRANAARRTDVVHQTASGAMWSRPRDATLGPDQSIAVPPWAGIG